jgi:hypothetical protein
MMKNGLIVGAAIAGLLSGCAGPEQLASRPDPDMTIAGGNPYQAERMVSPGMDPSPILTPNEKNQDKTTGSL